MGAGEVASGEAWTRRCGERVVHADSDEHVALVIRTLGIDAATWQATVDGYAELAASALSTEQKLGALADAFRAAVPLLATPAVPAAVSCAACREPCVKPVVARRAGTAPALVYGRCQACEHGQLLSGASTGSYAGRAYYERRESDGTGYADYVAERGYREAKGRDLVLRLLASEPAQSLLEVGSGYGFTLQAARAHGLRAQGVDLNPDAARGARELYGLTTLPGTLQQALDSGELPQAAWDIVLYQFVLEHVVDPRAELQQAARALAPGGRLVLVVPSMATFELDVFGGQYRSLRGDHLHLFSRQSITALLADADLSLRHLESHCNMGLLLGFLNADELGGLYAAGRGPDLTVLAGK